MAKAVAPQSMPDINQKEMTAPDFQYVRPAYADNNTPIVLCSDDGYALHAGVVIKSMIDCSSPETNYDIIILDGGISETSKQHIFSLAKTSANFCLRFVDVDHLLKKLDSGIFKLNVTAHFTKVTFYRLFIPEILRCYERVVYLDCDLVVRTDIAQLYAIDLQGKLLGAAKDYGMEIIRAEFNEFYSSYLSDTLDLRDPGSYFNAGVLVFDIRRSNERELTRRCVEKLVELERPVFADQCVLNSICQDDVFIIDLPWNFTVNNLLLEKSPLYDLPEKIYLDIMNAYRAPNIIHYSSNAKPWIDAFCRHEFAQYWWHCAHSAGFQGIFLDQIRRESGKDAGRNLMAGEQESRKSKFYLFGLPVFKLVKTEAETRVLLFGFIPLLRIKNS